MSEEHRLYCLSPSANAASTTHVYPQIITLNPVASFAPSMMISISEYNSLLDQFLDRGDEITRLQAVITNLETTFEVPSSQDNPPDEEITRLRAVVRNAAHYLLAKQDIGELSAVEDALLLELEKAFPGGAEVAHAPVSGKAFVQIEPGELPEDKE